MAGAAVLLVLGFAALAEPLDEAGAGVLVPFSLAALILGAALWPASPVFRITAMATASGAEPPHGFEVVSAWAGGLFLAWSVLGNAAAIGFRRHRRPDRLSRRMERVGRDRAGGADARPGARDR
jgi:hypothetical protein